MPKLLQFQFLIRQIAILLFLGSVSSSAAQNKTADSLQTVLKSYPKKDTIRVNLLNSIAYEIFAKESDKALRMLEESGTLSDALEYKKGKAFSLLYTANIQSDRSNYTNAFSIYQDALTIYQESNDKRGMANCYHNLGRIYFYQGDFDKAITLYNKSIATSEETGDQRRLATSLNGIAVIFSRQGNYDKAMQMYNRAMQIDEKLGNKMGLSNDQINLANLYKRKGDYNTALEYYHKSIELKEALGDMRNVAANFVNIGSMYDLLEKDEEAMKYYQMAYPIYEKLNYPRGMIDVQNNMGNLLMNHGYFSQAREYFDKVLKICLDKNDVSSMGTIYMNLGTLELFKKNYESSLAYFEKGLKFNRGLGDNRELSYAYLKMGKVYHAMKDYKKAEEYAMKSLELAKAFKHVDLQRDDNLLLSKIYYDTKQYKLAYEKSQTHKKLNDSIFKREGLDKLSEIKYQYKYKDRLSSANKRENSLKKTVKTRSGELESSQQQKFWWIGGFLFLFVLLGFGITLVKIRKVKMENKQLLTEQKLRRSQMNPHFIFNSIQNVRSLIHNKKEDEAVDYLNKFSKLTRQILESSDENYTSLAEEVELIKNYINIQQLLYHNAFEYDITIDETIDADATFLPPMLTQPFIENAIKHGLGNKSENGKLEIRFYLNQGKLFFEVLDNGKGFEAVKKQGHHKSMAMDITRKRLEHYTKNQEFVIQADNIIDQYKNILGAKVTFEIPYIYEN